MKKSRTGRVRCTPLGSLTGEDGGGFAFKSVSLELVAGT
jgi:hypothetical protein